MMKFTAFFLTSCVSMHLALFFTEPLFFGFRQESYLTYLIDISPSMIIFVVTFSLIMAAVSYVLMFIIKNLIEATFEMKIDEKKALIFTIQMALSALLGLWFMYIFLIGLSST